MTANPLTALCRALAERLDARDGAAQLLPFEEFCTSPEWCMFPQASLVQRALMRAADGLAPGLAPEQLAFHFGSPTFIINERPSVVVIECGVRSMKSGIAAFGALADTLRADTSVARPGELVKALVTAPYQRQTRATFGHIKGTALKSPRLAPLVVGEPNKEDMLLRRTDGLEVEIATVAAAADGSNLRSTWLTSAVVSEAAFFDDDAGAVNLAQQLIALRGRMLPGARIWVESSPTTDTDPFHKLAAEYFGRPRDGVLVFHSDSFSMFPGLDRDGERQLRASDPDKADREYFAVPTSMAGSEFFPEAAIRASVRHDRELVLTPAAGLPHWGGADLGFTKNSSALALCRCVGDRVILAYYVERKPRAGEPLKPTEVCADFAKTALAYNATVVRGDSYNLEVAREEFAKHRGPHGETVRFEAVDPTMDAKTEAFTAFRRLMLEGKLELSNDPALLRQLAETRSRVLPGGRVQIVVPKIGWTHGDVLEAVVRSAVQAVPSTSSFYSSMQRIMQTGVLRGR